MLVSSFVLIDCFGQWVDWSCVVVLFGVLGGCLFDFGEVVEGVEDVLVDCVQVYVSLLVFICEDVEVECLLDLVEVVVVFNFVLLCQCYWVLQQVIQIVIGCLCG